MGGTSVLENEQECGLLEQDVIAVGVQPVRPLVAPPSRIHQERNEGEKYEKNIYKYLSGATAWGRRPHSSSPKVAQDEQKG